MKDLNEHLLNITKKSLWDYKPYGTIDKDKGCSHGCKFFLPLKGRLGKDWGVCSNMESHRCGLLTFGDQGCNEFKG